MKTAKRTRSGKTSSPCPARKPGRPPIVAMNLAQEAAEALGSEGQERENLIGAALCIGQWLADQGRPGQWETTDPAAVLDLMSFARDEEANAFLLALVGLFGHAAFQEHMSMAAARKIIQKIQPLATNPAVIAFAAQAAHHLRPIPI